MSKFLMLSGAGEGFGLALRLRQAGHKVAVWARDKRAQHNYDGLLEKVTKWENYLDKETVVLFDSSGGGKTADRLKARGHYVWAGSTFADQLESDRGTAFELLTQAGVKCPASKTFYDWESGKSYARSQKGRLVFKASGELADEAGVRSYAASDSADMVAMLDYYEGIAHTPPEFELQEFVKGLPVSTEGWFNGWEFMQPFNHTIEHKSLMNDELGPSTGCAGCLCWRTDHNHVVEEGLALMERTLAEYNHIGPVDLNTIVNEDGVWALEFTPRMGYDAFATLLELVEGDIGEVIAKMARGEQPDELTLKQGFGASVRVSVPPHPSEQFKHAGGLPVRGFERTDRDHLFFYDVRLSDSNQLVTTPAYGCVFAATGAGRTISEAFEQPYALADKAKIPEKQYRTDLVNMIHCDHERFTQLVGARHNILHEVGGNP